MYADLVVYDAAVCGGHGRDTAAGGIGVWQGRLSVTRVWGRRF